MLTTWASPRANRSACRERGGPRRTISTLSARCNLYGGMCLARYLVMIGSHAGSRNPCFQAPFASAPAVGPGVFVRRGTEERVVAPFSANPAWSVEQPSIDDEAAAASCSDWDGRYAYRYLGPYSSVETGISSSGTSLSAPRNAWALSSSTARLSQLLTHVASISRA